MKTELTETEKKELERMRSVFPSSTSREVGFHENMRQERDDELSNGLGVLKGLRKNQLKEDPALADAVAMLRSRVKQLDSRPLRPVHCA